MKKTKLLIACLIAVSFAACGSTGGGHDGGHTAKTKTTLDKDIFVSSDREVGKEVSDSEHLVVEEGKEVKLEGDLDSNGKEDQVAIKVNGGEVTNQGSIELNGNGNTERSKVGILATKGGEASNDKSGTILLNDNEQKGMVAEAGGKVTNNGNINLGKANDQSGQADEGDEYNSSDVEIGAAPPVDEIEKANPHSQIGMMASSENEGSKATAINNQTININRDNAIGMMAQADKGEAIATNKGIINLNAHNGIGMLAKGKGATIENDGEIHLSGDQTGTYSDSRENTAMVAENSGKIVNKGEITFKTEVTKAPTEEPKQPVEEKSADTSIPASQIGKSTEVIQASTIGKSTETIDASVIGKSTDTSIPASQIGKSTEVIQASTIGKSTETIDASVIGKSTDTSIPASQIGKSTEVIQASTIGKSTETIDASVIGKSTDTSIPASQIGKSTEVIQASTIGKSTETIDLTSAKIYVNGEDYTHLEKDRNTISGSQNGPGYVYNQESIVVKGDYNVGILAESGRAFNSDLMAYGKINVVGKNSVGMIATYNERQNYGEPIIANIETGEINLKGLNDIGMLANNKESLASNNHEINIIGDYGIGMKATNGATADNYSSVVNGWEEVDGRQLPSMPGSDSGYQYRNYGVINLNGDNGIGMLADGKNSKINNSGSREQSRDNLITITGNNGIGMKAQNSGTATNYGLIKLDSSNGIGMLADGEGTVSNNDSNIKVIKDHGIGIKSINGATAFNQSTLGTKHNIYGDQRPAAFNGELTLEGNNGIGMLADGINSSIYNSRSVLSNYRNPSIRIRGNDGLGMKAINGGLARNYGEIVSTGKNSKGMLATDKNSININNGKIEITKIYGTSTADGDFSIGMESANGGIVKNYGVIDLNKNNGIGMKAKSKTEKTVAINEGTINLNKNNGIGMLADGQGAFVINKSIGTINLNGSQIGKYTDSKSNIAMMAINGGKIINKGKINFGKMSLELLPDANTIGISSGSQTNTGKIEITESTKPRVGNRIYSSGMIALNSGSELTNNGVITSNKGLNVVGMVSANGGKVINEGVITGSLHGIQATGSSSSLAINNGIIRDLILRKDSTYTDSQGVHNVKSILSRGMTASDNASIINGEKGEIKGEMSYGMAVIGQGKATNLGNISLTGKEYNDDRIPYLSEDNIKSYTYGMIGNKEAILLNSGSINIEGFGHGILVKNGSAINDKLGYINIDTGIGMSTYGNAKSENKGNIRVSLDGFGMVTKSGSLINSGYISINARNVNWFNFSAGMLRANNSENLNADNSLINNGVIDYKSTGMKHTNFYNSTGGGMISILGNTDESFSEFNNVNGNIELVNNNTVNIKSNNGIGMVVSDHRNSFSSVAKNHGTINLNASSGIGMLADGQGATVINETDGTIHLSGIQVNDGESIDDHSTEFSKTTIGHDNKGNVAMKAMNGGKIVNKGQITFGK